MAENTSIVPGSQIVNRGYGATAARLTPDQKVRSSNLSGLIPLARLVVCLKKSKFGGKQASWQLHFGRPPSKLLPRAPVCLPAKLEDEQWAEACFPGASTSTRGYGATAARLTPDQKVGTSNLFGLIEHFPARDNMKCIAGHGGKEIRTAALCL